MDLPTVLVKIAGALFFVWTSYSIYKYIKDKLSARATAPVSQSMSEHILNNILLYLWYAFMLAFSIGMIVNN